MQARRTRAYNSTLYILYTFHRVASNSIEGGGWYGFAAPLPDAHPRLAGILLLRPLQFRRLQAPELMADVYLGVKYKDGVAIEAPVERIAA